MRTQHRLWESAKPEPACVQSALHFENKQGDCSIVGGSCQGVPSAPFLTPTHQASKCIHTREPIDGASAHVLCQSGPARV